MGLGNIVVCEMGWCVGIYFYCLCVFLIEMEWECLVIVMREYLVYLLEEEDVDEIYYFSEKVVTNLFYCYGCVG